MADTTTTTSNDLQGFASGGDSQYIKMETGIPVEGLYLGYTMEDDKFNPGDKRIVYQLEIGQLKKFLGSGSKRLARAILAANPAVGEFIRITRVGVGFDTNYKVETQDIPF